MATTLARTPAYFRFQSTLMDELKQKAKASNSSLNSYVESLLIGILHPMVKEEDDAPVSKNKFIEKVEKAISEVKEGKSYAMKPGESLDAFMDRMEEEGKCLV